MTDTNTIDFRDYTSEELEVKFLKLGRNYRKIKAIKNTQEYHLLKTLLRDDAIKELKNFKTIVWEDSFEDIRQEILHILDSRRN